MWKDICNLITKTEIVDLQGNVSYTTIPKTVYCNVKSVKASEFYNAQRSNMKPELVLVMRSIEYGDEVLISYNDISYRVLRTYIVGENVEITLTKEVI